MWHHHAASAASEAAYMGTDSRAHSLLVGAVLAVVLYERVLPRWARRPVEILAVGAAVWLAWLMRTVGATEGWLYRGGFAAIAIATALVIAAAVDTDSRFVRPVLSWTPLRWIGLVSYGVYLFHVPLMTLVDSQYPGLHGGGLVGVHTLVVAAVACVSYFLVERPIRSQRLHVGWTTTAAATLVTVGLLLVVTVGGQPVPASALVTFHFQQLGATGRTRVLAVGDQFTASLGDGVDVAAIRGATAIAHGCSIDGAPIVVGTRALPASACAAPQAAVVQAALSGFGPQYALIALGPAAVFDRRVDGQTARVGTPEFARHVVRVLDAVRGRSPGADVARDRSVHEPAARRHLWGPRAGRA